MRSHVKLLVFALLICAGVSLACSRADGSAKTKNSEAAPDFELLDSYQKGYSLSSYRDKQAVLLFFWTTWCPYCQGELKALNQMYTQLLKDGVEVLAINVGEAQDKVEKTVQRYLLAYKVLLDMDTSVAHSFDIIGVPTYILVDKGGSIISKTNRFPEGQYKKMISE